MKLLGKLFKPNSASVAANDLECFFMENKIPYEIEDFNESKRISYINPMDKKTIIIENTKDGCFIDGNEISAKEAKKLIDNQWKHDKRLMKYMDTERYSEIFDISDFFKEIASEDELSSNVIPLKDSEGVRVYYQIGGKATEEDYMIAIELNDMGIMKILPSETETNANAAVLSILIKIKEKSPSLYGKIYPRAKDDMYFAKMIKSYLIHESIVERFNGIPNVDAHIIDLGNTNRVFVILENDSAIEYQPPSEGGQKGKFLFIDFDEDNKVEDNDSFETICHILNMTTQVNYHRL